MESEYFPLRRRSGFVGENCIARSGSYSLSESVNSSCKKNPQRVNEYCHHWFGKSTQAVSNLDERRTCAVVVRQFFIISIADSRSSFCQTFKYFHKYDCETNAP